MGNSALAFIRVIVNTIYKIPFNSTKTLKFLKGECDIMQVQGFAMKSLIVAVAAVVLCAVFVCGAGMYAQAFAKNRLVPIYCVNRTDKVCAISFDAAWGADKTRSIMDVCDKYGVKATFFLVGFWVDKYPEMTAEIQSRGFEIGTHSDTHPHMSKLSADEIAKELSASSRKIFDITGAPVTLFRPPFGDYNNTLLTVCGEQGLMAVQWSVDSLDWKGLSAGEIAARVQRADSGDIILCHNNSDHIVEALPLIFEAMRLKGLSVVPVGELVYREGYYIDGTGRQKLLVQTQTQ